MKKKPKKVEYFTFLEDREFKESEWMGKRKPISKCILGEIGVCPDCEDKNYQSNYTTSVNCTLHQCKHCGAVWSTTNQTKNSSKLVTKPKEELEELDNIIRGILFEHTDKVYGYFKSKGKDNFDDTVFVDKIKDLLLKQKDEAYKTGREDEAIECYKDLEKTMKEYKASLIKKIGLLRQWLNEDRITEPKKMITNKDIEDWLF